MALATIRAPADVRVVSEDLLQLFNQQVTNELEASQLYLAASVWFDQADMIGMSKFMRRESDDERHHAILFIDFANKRNMHIRLDTVQAPDADWATPEEVWEDLLEGEKENTQALLKVADAAQKSQDHAMVAFLMPFHMEQVDSEDKLRTIVSKVRDENKTPGLLRQLDSELGLESSSHGGQTKSA